MVLFSCLEFVCVFNLNSIGIVSKQEGTLEHIDHVLFKTNTHGGQYKTWKRRSINIEKKHNFFTPLCHIKL